MKTQTMRIAALSAVVSLAFAGSAQAKHGADDPANHDAGDDSALVVHHDLNDDNGVDDPATHDLGDDRGVPEAGAGADDTANAQDRPEKQPKHRRHKHRRHGSRKAHSS